MYDKNEKYEKNGSDQIKGEWDAWLDEWWRKWRIWRQWRMLQKVMGYTFNLAAHWNKLRYGHFDILQISTKILEAQV